MSARRSARRGSAGKTALGLLVLGCSSAVFGALVVGPNLGKRLGSDTPITVEKRKPAAPRMAQASAPEPDAQLQPTRSERSRADAGEEAPSVNIRRSEERAAPVERERTPEPRRTETERSPRPEPVAEPPDEPVSAAPSHRERPRREAAPERSETRETRREPEPEVPAPRRQEREREAPERTAPARPRDVMPELRRDTPPERKAPAPRKLEEAKPAEKREPRATPRLASARVPPARTAPAAENPPDVSSGSESGKVFRVRIGWFRERGAAEEVCQHLNETSAVKASVVPVGRSFRVQVGAYRNRTNAERVADELRARSFAPDVTENTPAP